MKFVVGCFLMMLVNLCLFLLPANRDLCGPTKTVLNIDTDAIPIENRTAASEIPASNDNVVESETSAIATSDSTRGEGITAARKTMPCGYCDLMFASRDTAKRHERIHTGERPYICKVCWKTFSDRSSLWQHSRLHTGQQPFCCKQCGLTFRWRKSLRSHRCSNFKTGHGNDHETAAGQVL